LFERENCPKRASGADNIFWLVVAIANREGDRQHFPFGG
jgi:hypothetical protein